MSLFSIFDVAGSGLSAQSLRMNVTASNLANAGSASGDVSKVYRARHPIFRAAMAETGGGRHSVGVTTRGVIESQTPLQIRHQPEHPEADENGNVFVTNVNPIEEMANMISASRSYQSNIEVLNTSKEMLLRTLTLGQ